MNGEIDEIVNLLPGNATIITAYCAGYIAEVTTNINLDLQSF